MNAIFFALVFIAFAIAGYRELSWPGPELAVGAGASSPMEVLTLAVVDSAGGAVTLAIGLVGMMALFLGLMKVAEAGG
ncbi:MAG: spore maturation protein, partial [Kiloniellales bacterium]